MTCSPMLDTRRVTQTPLTFQQRWLLGLLQQHADWKCVVPYGVRVRGSLSIPALERSIEQVIRRHGSLRARLVPVGAEVAQELDELHEYTLECVGVPGSSPEAIEVNARTLFEEFSEIKVDLAEGPLFLVRLLELSDKEHWLLMAAHRIVADCFSVEQMLPEVWALYADILAGRTPSLPNTAAQYRDYAIWQYEGRDEWVKRHQAYWLKRLSAARSIEWPVDGGAAGAGARGALGRMNILFGEALSQQLRDYARVGRTLAATVVLAAYIAALCRYCRQRDFVVPCFIAGRQSEHKSIIGYFSHILLIRVELTGRETFSELLRTVGNEFFRALTHQDFGRMAIQEPQLLRGTFFQWLTWHPQGEQSVPVTVGGEAQNLTVDRVSVSEFAENLTAIPPGVVDVEVTFFDTPQGIYASGVYRADRFTPDTMDQFMRLVRSSAEELVLSPAARAASAR